MFLAPGHAKKINEEFQKTQKRQSDFAQVVKTYVVNKAIVRAPGQNIDGKAIEAKMIYNGEVPLLRNGEFACKAHPGYIKRAEPGTCGRQFPDKQPPGPAPTSTQFPDKQPPGRPPPKTSAEPPKETEPPKTESPKPSGFHTMCSVSIFFHTLSVFGAKS
jgi:hypothetical protein